MRVLSSGPSQRDALCCCQRTPVPQRELVDDVIIGANCLVIRDPATASKLQLTILDKSTDPILSA